MVLNLIDLIINQKSVIKNKLAQVIRVRALFRTRGRDEVYQVDLPPADQKKWP